MPIARSAMMRFCFSAASSAMTYTAASAMAATPGHQPGPTILRAGSDALTYLLPDEARWPPHHQRDDNREGEHVLVGAGERQQHGPNNLQPGEQEAAEDRAVDAAEAADDGGGKTNHAEIEADAEIHLVVVEPVHHAGEGGQPRADREGDEHDRREVDSHRARGLFVLRDGADGETELGAIEEQMKTEIGRASC